jgi:tetraacyldisaccharide 4'-kinase
VISTLYAAIARRRREWYANHPAARARLRHPVISIGNIATGGRGKTPFTATVVRELIALGEVPAVLSRGYARTDTRDRLVIVRDRDALRADVPRAGDEPFMLARQLPGAIVISGPDRFAGGRMAETELGATVHVLDDGFQHFKLDRDADIVLVSRADLEGAQTLPAGHLREPADVLIAADAVVTVDPSLSVNVPHAAVFRARRRALPAVFDADNRKVSARSRVFAFAGIAGPDAFFESVTAQGWDVAATRSFGDHHPFSARELNSLFDAAAAAGAAALITTEKDYVRLLAHRPFRMPVGWVPLTMAPEPPETFRAWLASVVSAARDSVIA